MLEDPVPEKPNRLPTLLLATGAAVLLVAILLGERMGDRVLGQVAHRPQQALVVVSPEPEMTSGPYGPDWKRSETLTAAPDPRFPDPRVPPVPLPTRPPATPTPAPPSTPTPNPNIPIWRQQPLPTVPPIVLPSTSPAPSLTP